MEHKHKDRRATAVTLPNVSSFSDRRMSLSSKVTNKRVSFTGGSHHSPSTQQSNDISQVLLMNLAMKNFRKQHDIILCIKLASIFHKWKSFSLNVAEEESYRSAHAIPNILKQSMAFSEYSEGYWNKNITKINAVVMKWLLVSNRKLDIKTAWTKWLVHKRYKKYPESDPYNDEKLFEANAQIEILKVKLHSFKKNTLIREKVFHDGFIKNQLKTLFRTRLKNSLRRRFELWRNNILKIVMSEEMKKQQTQVNVGMQHISSEREMVKDVQVLSVKLRSQLLFTQAFYSWKLHNQRDIRMKERQKWADEKYQIMSELISLRKLLFALNRQEEMVVQTAFSNGKDVLQTLQGISERIAVQKNLHTSISGGVVNAGNRGDVPTGFGVDAQQGRQRSVGYISNLGTGKDFE
jgi:hypothetical protein